MTHLACTPRATSRTRAGAHALGRHGPRHLAVVLLVAGAAALAACSFDPSGLDPGEPDRPDADPSMPDANPFDANPDIPDAAPCAWDFVPRYVNPCLAGKPDPQMDLILPPGVPVVYDTTSGTFEGFVPPAGLATTDEAGVHTLWVRSFTAVAGVTLRVTGDDPLMIVASGAITVNGTIDASSRWNPGSASYDRGPGLEPSECPADRPAAGSRCGIHGGSGGGGGGFGGAGGQGGDGGGLRGCGDGNDSSPGGAGGEAAATPDKIRAGCDGARGGSGEEDAWWGEGGAGGGAIHLVAREGIEVGGTIHAGGGGGAEATDKRSGGGGGGSGGFIGLEAPVIELGSDAVLAANGGGGGGGTNTKNEASPGANGLPEGVAATGGTGHDGGGLDATGGNGSALADLDGDDGGDSDRGGGGGGGGAGFILFYQSAPMLTGSPVISPPPTEP